MGDGLNGSEFVQKHSVPLAMESSSSVRCTAAILGSIALGVCALIVATHQGIGLYPDSIVYIGAARNILDGRGVQFLNDVGEIAPVVQYPPLYSVMIAALGALGLDPLEGARWLSIFFYAVTAFLSASIVRRITFSVWASWFACILSLNAFPMIYISSQALTEPIFICFVLIALIMLAEFFESERSKMLYGAALMIGLSCLVRYVGIALIATGGLAILVLSKTRWISRLRAAMKFGLIGSLPLAIWVARNLFAAGNATNRTFSFHPPALNDLLPALDTAGYWLLPIPLVENMPFLSRAVVGVILLLTVWLLSQSRYLKTPYVQLLVFWLLGYSNFLLLSMSLNDQPLYFDTRTLALPYMTVMPLAVSLICEWLEKKPALPFGLRPAIAAVLTLQVINGIVWLKQSYADGIGFATEQWRTSELIVFARKAPDRVVIFSNAPDFIVTLANRPARMIPRKINPETFKPNQHYAAELDVIRQDLAQPDSILVYFDDDSRLWYLPSPAELEAMLPLKVIKSARGGKIYRWDDSRV
ncbi:MAG TPA: glycosyltransferase family 39 protein [Candidatus Binatia bacterium]